jgi:hypothetical protein
VRCGLWRESRCVLVGELRADRADIDPEQPVLAAAPAGGQLNPVAAEPGRHHGRIAGADCELRQAEDG